MLRLSKRQRQDYFQLQPHCLVNVAHEASRQATSDNPADPTHARSLVCGISLTDRHQYYRLD